MHTAGGALTLHLSDSRAAQIVFFFPTWINTTIITKIKIYRFLEKMEVWEWSPYMEHLESTLNRHLCFKNDFKEASGGFRQVTLQPV